MEGWEILRMIIHASLKQESFCLANWSDDRTCKYSFASVLIKKTALILCISERETDDTFK